MFVCEREREREQDRNTESEHSSHKCTLKEAVSWLEVILLGISNAGLSIIDFCGLTLCLVKFNFLKTAWPFVFYSQGSVFLAFCIQFVFPDIDIRVQQRGCRTGCNILQSKLFLSAILQHVVDPSHSNSYNPAIYRRLIDLSPCF